MQTTSRILAMAVTVVLCLSHAGPAAANARVRAARGRAEGELKRLIRAQGLAYPPREIFLRAFKKEKTLELWARSDQAKGFTLITSYAICAASGSLGPKRRSGDRQVPEGFYTIDRFNPHSGFHLSLRIDYPNAADRILGRQGSLGSDIFIHGS